MNVAKLYVHELPLWVRMRKLISSLMAWQIQRRLVPPDTRLILVKTIDNYRDFHASVT